MTDSIRDSNPSNSRSNSLSSSPTPDSQRSSSTAVDGKPVIVSLLNTGNNDKVTTALKSPNRPQTAKKDIYWSRGTTLRNRVKGSSRNRGQTGPGRKFEPRSVPPRRARSKGQAVAATEYPETRPREPKLKATDQRSGGNKVLRRLLGGLGALVGIGGGGYGGAAVGTLVGTLVLPGIGTIAGAIAGGVLGSLVGGAAGTTLGDYCFVQPQKAHLDKAITELLLSRGEFTEGETKNLEAVTDEQWRKLLHVPSSKGRFMPFEGSGAGARVKGPERRQKIRQALVARVAVTGNVKFAEALKKKLVEAANADDANALDQAIAQDRLNTISARLGLGQGDVTNNEVGTVLRQAKDPQMVVTDQAISAFLVSRVAARAALQPTGGLGGGAAHRRAAYAVVAHQARYAPLADLMSATAPGSQSLAKILDLYRGAFRTTLDTVRTLVATRGPAARLSPRFGGGDRQAITNLDATMATIVGSDHQGLQQAVQRVPDHLRFLLQAMSRAAEQHAPVDPKKFARLAVFHGLLGSDLSSHPSLGVWQAETKAQAASLDNNNVQVVSTFMLSAQHDAPRAPVSGHQAGQVIDEKSKSMFNLDDDSDSSDDDMKSVQEMERKQVWRQETLEGARTKWAPRVSAFVEHLIATGIHLAPDEVSLLTIESVDETVSDIPPVDLNDYGNR